ncbi:hypothetical protein HMPREF9406_2295 [Clostridium sp. HGF2]|nr:hypothetical protein HMPREF9406_2295 [Clostridium sp. HGF2]EQJ59839.1 hypothetical protein QSI_1403 [Clostridioides difficile P28]
MNVFQNNFPAAYAFMRQTSLSAIVYSFSKGKDTMTLLCSLLSHTYTKKETV